MQLRALFGFALALAACTKPQGVPASTGPSPAASTASSGLAATALDAGSDVSAEASAGAESHEGDASFGAPSPFSGAEAEGILFADAPNGALARARECPVAASAHDRTTCLLDLRFANDRVAAKTAQELYERHGILAGVDVDHMMNGGYRGILHLVPAPPTGKDRRHLEWVLAAADDFKAFFTGLEARGARDVRFEAGKEGLEARGARDVRYRFRSIALRFMRSVAARTPSAYAEGWEVAYNLNGSLLVSADAVRETMFHEIFHLNDASHGSHATHDAWSETALSLVFDSIVRKCGTALTCLTPFTPNTTVVRGGTYYSFQPGNGVREYAAELSIRYYREQRAILRAQPTFSPFKCGPPANARAWELIVNEFFGGFDLTAPCRAPLAR